MLRIRLSRLGKKKQPTYRLTVSEKNKDTYGDALEILGNYDPRRKTVSLKEDRIKYWLSQGASASDSVHNLLVEHGVVDGPKVKVSSLKKKKKGKEEKTDEKVEGEVKVEKKSEESEKNKVEEKEEKKEDAETKDEESKDVDGNNKEISSEESK